MIPRQILRDYLPKDVARAVRGTKGSPNIWKIPALLHDAIHQGPGGGLFIARWIDELSEHSVGELTRGWAELC